jgi:hypothetical protein
MGKIQVGKARAKREAVAICNALKIQFGADRELKRKSLEHAEMLATLMRYYVERERLRRS